MHTEGGGALHMRARGDATCIGPVGPPVMATAARVQRTASAEAHPPDNHVHCGFTIIASEGM